LSIRSRLPALLLRASHFVHPQSLACAAPQGFSFCPTAATCLCRSSGLFILPFFPPRDNNPFLLPKGEAQNRCFSTHFFLKKVGTFPLYNPSSFRKFRARRSLRTWEKQEIFTLSAQTRICTVPQGFSFCPSAERFRLSSVIPAALGVRSIFWMEVTPSKISTFCRRLGIIPRACTYTL